MMKSSGMRTGSTVLAALVFSAALAACGGGKSSQASQVVAEVDDSEITVSQLSEALAARGMQSAPPQQARQAVDSLINEQLLVKSALDNKLDRDPGVVQALEHTRRQVLARAYVERMVYPREEISAAQQIEYYKKHPALFENRKTYQVMVYTVKDSELGAPVRAELANAHSTEDVAKVLTAHNIQHESQSLTRGAEQLPLEELPKFTAAHVGDLVVMQAHEGHLPMMLITGIQDSPISVDRAQPIIQQYLVNSRNVQALENHLKQARATAKIAYFDSVSSAAKIAGQLETAVAREEASQAPGKTVSLN
ncbi:MAG: EpsD family peptidyl-prolyl cis-trans isomerase [Gammaproteobacteria bacterium]